MGISKRFSKKISICITAFSLLLMIVLSGCGSSKTSSKGSNGSKNTVSINATIKVFAGKNTTNPQAQQKLYKKLISQFEKQNPGIHVNFTTFSSSSQEDKKLQTSIATNQGPTIFELGTTFIPTAYATNGFHVFSQKDWKAIGGKSKIFPAQLKMSGPDSNHYIGVPFIMGPYAMVYNKKMFAKAGIQSPPKTWTQFVKDAKKLTKPSQNQWGVTIDPSSSYQPWKFGWMFTRQAGGRLVSKDGKKALLDSKQSVKGLKFWFDWITKYKIASPNDVTNKATDSLKAFENGHAAMLLLSKYSKARALDHSSVKNDYAFAPQPSVPYGMSKRPSGADPAESIVSGQDYAVPKYVKGDQYQAALKWIKFMTDVKAQRDLFKAEGDLPVNQNAYQNDKSLNTKTIKQFVAAERNATPTPFIGAWGNFEQIYAGVCSKIANKIGTGNYQPSDIAKILKSANKQLQQALQ